MTANWQNLQHISGMMQNKSSPKGSDGPTLGIRYFKLSVLRAKFRCEVLHL
jgi:hypothetical protein